MKKANSYKHGYSNTRLYGIYAKMLNRCTKPKDPNFKRYGAREIDICEEWKTNRESFFSWAISNGYSDDLSLDRIDNNGDYSPENCRWTTPTIQANNRRSNVRVDYNGESHTLAEWSLITGVPKNRISWRLKQGWALQDALFTKPMTPSEAGQLGDLKRWGKRGKSGR